MALCALTVGLSAGCGSGSPEPAMGAANPAAVAIRTTTLAQAARDAGCPADIRGMAVRHAGTDVDTDALRASGGVCQLARSAHDAALRFTRDVFIDRSCDMARKVADRFGDGDHVAAHVRLQELVDAGEMTESDARPMMFVVSGCASDRAIDSTAASMVALTTADMYSIGTFQQAGRTCEGVLWTQRRASIGDHYQLTGLNGCDGISLQFDDVYHPDDRPDGRLPGDLMRDDAGYTGRIPADYEYKGDRYRFASKTNAPPLLAAATPVRGSGPSSDGVATRHGGDPASQPKPAWRPACSAMASNIRTVANSDSPIEIRMRRIDGMLDRAPPTCF